MVTGFDQALDLMEQTFPVVNDRMLYIEALWNDAIERDNGDACRAFERIFHELDGLLDDLQTFLMKHDRKVVFK
jgi:hypothetical protein